MRRVRSARSGIEAYCSLSSAKGVGKPGWAPGSEQRRTGTRSFSLCRAQLRPNAPAPALGARSNAGGHGCLRFAARRAVWLPKDVVWEVRLDVRVRGRTAATGGASGGGDVISQAGCSRSTFYAQFADMEDCLGALLSVLADELFGEVRSAVEAAPPADAPKAPARSLKVKTAIVAPQAQAHRASLREAPARRRSRTGRAPALRA